MLYSNKPAPLNIGSRFALYGEPVPEAYEWPIQALRACLSLDILVERPEEEAVEELVPVVIAVKPKAAPFKKKQRR